MEVKELEAESLDQICLFVCMNSKVRMWVGEVRASSVFRRDEEKEEKVDQ